MIVNNSGFTLIEFLVALVILMVGLLGLLQSVNLAMDKNLENVFRTEAVMLADERLMAQRAKSFDSLSITDGNPAGTYLARDIRGIMKNYSVQEIVSQPTERSKQLVVNVSWRKKGVRYSHSISSVVSTF